MLRKTPVRFTKNLETSKNGGLMQALFLVIKTIRYGIITITMLRIFIIYSTLTESLEIVILNKILNKS